MKIVHWNCSKKSQSIIGIKRYEDELLSNITRLNPELEVTRIHRPDNLFLGNTILSWLFYRAQNADIVHATCQTIAPAIFFHRSKKLLLTILDIVPLVYPSAQTDITVRLQWLIIPHAIRRIQRFIAISDFTKRELIRLLNVPEQDISIVHLGVNHSQYFPLNKINCKKHFHLNPDEKHILVVASNLQHKRMDLAKKIIQSIRARRKDIKMIKVGYGEQLNGKGIINFGWVSEAEMPMLYNAADVFLHTSEYEGFGLPILEAMACGVPVVVSNKASIPEIVQNTGNLIDISSSGCVSRFTDAILENIDTGIDRLAITQSKKFTWETTARNTVEIYEDLYRSTNIVE